MTVVAGCGGRWYKSNMLPSEKQKKLAAVHRDVKYKFILTELDLALTFCQMARTAYGDEAKSNRNMQNAQRAYEAANHFLQDAGFSKTKELSLLRKVSHLKGMLAELQSQAFAEARHGSSR
jgi:hypothetical protein